MAGITSRGLEGHDPTSNYYPDENRHGNYQYINIDDIVANFTTAYIGEGKIFQKILSGDVRFHAHRALQELSYDTLKSCKTQEIVLPPSLQMILPHDYVNYTKIAWSDANGIEHIIYPTSKTGNHNTIQQNADGSYKYATNNKKEAKLVQDNTPNCEIRGYKIKHKNGYDWDENKIIASYSGPWKLYREWEHFLVDDENYPISSSNVITETTIKVGMEVKHISLPAGTTVTSVALVQSDDGDWLETEFYLSNATLIPDLESVNGFFTGPSLENTGFLWFDDISNSSTWSKYKGSGGTSIGITDPLNPAIDNSNYFTNTGQRYGLDPQYAQANGSFFINCDSGKIHFSSDLAGKTIILHYLSDRNGNDCEALVPKLAEEAMYKWIAYGCASARVDIPEGIIQRLKREKFAETRKAKIRLSNIKIEEITQIMRGKSKFIDH